jgi:hypothetical protein
MDKDLGRGTLIKLEKLKAKYADELRAAAPKVKRINERCFALLCPTAIARVGMARGGYLRVDRPTCTRKRCPREKEESYGKQESRRV